MTIGILSDTHDNVTAIEQAVEIFDEEQVDVIIHCGDYIAPPTIPYYEGFEVHGVIGNNDGEIDGLERSFDALGANSQLHGRYADLELDGHRIFVLHGDQGMDAVDEYAASGEYDYVCYGHFHAAEQRHVDETTVINPGGHFPTVPAADRSVVVLKPDSEPEFVRLEMA